MGPTQLDRSSRRIMNAHTARLFEGPHLVDRLARAVCEAGCMPRKEFFESWETARRIRRRLRGGRIVELAAGHGLLSAILLVLDRSSPDAVCVDRVKPLSHERVLAALDRTWPGLAARQRFEEGDLQHAQVPPDAMLVSVHACGALTDHVLDLAIERRVPVAVVPCCHALDRCDTGALEGWMDGPLAVDATRAARLRQAGFAVYTCTIPQDITPKNRLLIGEPLRSSAASSTA